MSVRAAQREINSREFQEWRAFDRISPIGGRRLDWNAASIAAAIINTWTTGKRITPQDVILEFGPRERMGADAIERKLRVLLKDRIKV